MTEFQVTNQTTGRKYSVRPSENILDAILRHGSAVSYSCRNGTCAACKADLVSGRVVYDEYSKSALSDEEAADGAVLLCRAHPRENVEIRAPELSTLFNATIQKLPCRILSLNRLTHDVMEVKLRLPPRTSFHYIAGQYIDIMMRDGRKRGFSIANPPGIEDIIALHVRHVPNGRFTTYVFQSMKKGDIFRFEGPLGTFFLRDDSDQPLIMIAGGTGFAPIHAIIEDMILSNTRRKIHLFWGVRDQQDLYHTDKIDTWKQFFGDEFHSTAVLSEPKDDDDWHGETGWVHDAVLRCYPDLTQYEVYASGPPPMIDVIREKFPEYGLNPANLFYDSFEFSSDTLYPSR